MPERTPTRYPTILAGTNLESGTPNTGQITFTQGGTRLSSVLSGVVGPDINLWVGGGRLDNGFIHSSTMQALSGQSIVFYDSAVAVSGGPLSTSGHKVVGVLSVGALGNTAVSGANIQGGLVQQFQTPFTSGLCYTTRSGQPGFSVCFTPVVSG